jgi:hypothetical protein
MKSIHDLRVYGVSIIDVILTILGALAISYFFGIGLVPVLIMLFVLGIILHRVLGVNTAVDSYLKKLGV